MEINDISHIMCSSTIGFHCCIGEAGYDKTNKTFFTCQFCDSKYCSVCYQDSKKYKSFNDLKRFGTKCFNCGLYLYRFGENQKYFIKLISDLSKKKLSDTQYYNLLNMSNRISVINDCIHNKCTVYKFSPIIHNVKKDKCDACNITYCKSCFSECILCR